MTVVSQRFRELGPPIAEQFNKLRDQSGTRKIMIHDGLNGSVMQMLVWTNGRKNALVYAMYLTWHNMSKTAINSRRQVTSLRMVLTKDGAVTRCSVQRATGRELETYCAAFPQYRKTLLDFEHAES